jgi:hypothetical protein
MANRQQGVMEQKGDSQSFKHHNKLSGSTKAGKFLEHLTNYKDINKNSGVRVK